MRFPLRRQILLPMVGILLLTIGVVSVLNAWLASARVQQQIETQLADVQRTLSAGNFPLESNVLRQMRGLTGAEYVVANERGEVIAASDDQFVDLTAAGYEQRIITLDRRPVGGGQFVLHVFYPVATLREAQVQAVWPPLAIGGGAILLVVAAAYWVAQRVTQPVQQLRTQVQRIAEGDFQPAPTPSRDDEIRDLVAAVNQMAEKLARYEEETRQSERLKTLGTLGGGIAHQIRNAATGCRIALDLHLRDHPPSENGDGESPLGVATRQLELIETHIQRFLALGRTSAAPKKLVELRDVAEQAIALAEPMARHAGISIEFSRPDVSLQITGDEEALAQMLLNLLVNAVEATARTRVMANTPSAADCDSQPIVVELRRTPAGWELAVGDPGPGPAPAIQARLFQPFATDKPGGTGLGLVVSRKIAEDHGGRIRWQRRDERTWFTVELPIPG